MSFISTILDICAEGGMTLFGDNGDIYIVPRKLFGGGDGVLIAAERGRASHVYLGEDFLSPFALIRDGFNITQAHRIAETINSVIVNFSNNTILVTEGVKKNV